MLPDDESSKSSFSKIFTGPDILNDWQARNKKFISVSLTGDVNEDEKRFEFIKNEARRLKYTNDTTNIIRVHFNEDNTYGQFVNLVNMMARDFHKRYMYYKDDFYIMGEQPTEASK